MFPDILGGLGKGNVRRPFHRECNLELGDLVRYPLILVTCPESCEVNSSKPSEKNMVLVVFGDTVQHEDGECTIAL